MKVSTFNQSSLLIAFLLSQGAEGFVAQKNSLSNTFTTKGKTPRIQHIDTLDLTGSDRSAARILSQSSSCTVQDDPLNNRHSASDWLYNVRSLPQSNVLREIRGPVLAVAGWSLVVSLVQKIGSSSIAHPALRYFVNNMSIPGTAHGFLVSALGLLLVFRTNSAYQRFNEGRKIWENILSVSRNMSRMIHLYSKDIGEERMQRILNLVAAYPYLLRQHIRPGCLCAPQDKKIDEENKLILHENFGHRNLPETRHEGQRSLTLRSDQLITESDQACPRECWVDRRDLPWSLFKKSSLPQIARAENRPLWVCDRIASVMMQIPYGPNFTSRERLTLLKMVDSLTNAVGQCERIHQTAVPLNYARHSLRSLTLWLFTLPFALVKDLGMFTAPVSACIAWVLFGVYQIGYSIEDPFQGSLRLSILCDAIRRNVIGHSDELRDSAFSVMEEERTFENIDHLPSSTANLPPPLMPNESLPTALLVDQNLLNAPQFVSANDTRSNMGI